MAMIKDSWSFDADTLIHPSTISIKMLMLINREWIGEWCRSVLCYDIIRMILVRGIFLPVILQDLCVFISAA